MNTPMIQLPSLEALSARMCDGPGAEPYSEDRLWANTVRAQAARVGGDRVVLFECLEIRFDPTPPQIMLVGPGCTYANPDAVSGQHLGDVPSRFLWPTAWAWVNTSEGDPP